MNGRITRHSAGAALEVRAPGVLVVQLFGPLTAEALLDVKASIVANYSATNFWAFVADYRRCIVAMDGAGLDSILAGERHGSVPTLPAAMIVPAGLFELFQGHSLRMAAQGFVRQSFTDAAAAFAWADRHAVRRMKTRTAEDPREARPADQRKQPASPADGAAA